MLAFPLSLALVPYAIVVAVFLVFAFFNIHHLIRYSATTGSSFIFTALFLMGSTAIFAATWFVLGDVDWARTVTIDFANAVAPAAAPGIGL
jgi:hypothetical protein